MSATAAAVAAGAAAGGGGIIGSVIQGEYNKYLQDMANNFTREQSQNQIKYNVQQMKDLGLSPMMLFDNGNAAGGGAGGGKIGAGAPNFGAGIIEGINTVGRILAENEKRDLEERKVDLMQDYNDHKFQYLNDRLSNQINSAKNFEQRTYSKDYMNNLFDDLDKI